VLWIFDGVLQAQPSLFTANFFGMMLRMGQSEPPGWLWDLESRIEPFVTTHAWGCNLACAAVQLAVGLAICWRPTTRAALGASVGWALVVWLFGESAGGLFSPGASALTGAPGAALLYALLAMLVWPPRENGAPHHNALRLAPDLAWSCLWLGTAALELDALNRSGFIVGSTLASVSYTAPPAFSSLDHAASAIAGGSGTRFAALLAGTQIVISLGIWLPRARRPTLVLAIVAAVFFGVVGQNLGGIFSNGLTGILESGATDPGSGPILVLLALALWPTPGQASKQLRREMPLLTDAKTAWAGEGLDRRSASLLTLFSRSNIQTAHHAINDGGGPRPTNYSQGLEQGSRGDPLFLADQVPLHHDRRDVLGQSDNALCWG
jgi:hypothetical protein